MMKTCISCGKALDPAAKFCIYCGAKQKTRDKKLSDPPAPKANVQSKEVELNICYKKNPLQFLASNQPVIFIDDSKAFEMTANKLRLKIAKSTFTLKAQIPYMKTGNVFETAFKTSKQLKLDAGYSYEIILTPPLVITSPFGVKAIKKGKLS
jgi:hypothetical protein